MSNKIELAKAYVQIIPSAEGMKNNLMKVFNGEEGTTREAGTKAGQIWTKAAGAAISASAAAVTAAATGVVAVAKEALTSYAQYEQLVGGVETLFKNSADEVRKYAADAYETAGLSANEYMETATSFSASLLQGLGGDTAKAAELADLAITDMSDNANKMGTSMESIQNAYQGFAKQNYTMLDNLKLGYGGTQQEMVRLMNDSGILNETISSLDGITFDQMIEAIHAIQENMDIAGCTGEEARSTIEGSLKMTEASWKNLLTGLADDNADFVKLINDFVQSIGLAAENILPRIAIAINGIANVVTELAPILAGKVSELVQDTLPVLLKAAVSLVQAVATALPSVVKVLAEQIPTVITSLLNVIIDTLPILLDVAVVAVTTIADGLGQALPNLIPALIDVVTTMVGTLIENADLIIEAALELIKQLDIGLMLALPNLIEALPGLITKLVKALLGIMPMLFRFYKKEFTDIWFILSENLPEWFAHIGDMLKGMCDKVKEWGKEIVHIGANIAIDFVKSYIKIYRELPNKMWDVLVNALTKIAEFRHNLRAKAIEIASTFIQSLVASLAGLPEQLMNIGQNIMIGLWNGIQDKLGWIQAKINGMGQEIIKSIKGVFGIHSPSRVFRDEIGKMLDLGLAEGIDKNAYLVREAVDDMTKINPEEITTSLLMNAAINTNARNDIGASDDTMLAIYGLLERYLPECAEPIDGRNLIAGINRQLGLAVM